MKFVRLRLQGFKSFVDPTELVIQPGLTGVVGPNGCGKSNLLEAIRWVMGESSAKAMRGGGMEDVIFAGAASRPARAFAEVALHLDNSARRAPAAFNHHDALEVVRRIARDAGSAYRLNGREARARDVRMLFADAATGAHSPALVRQGRIAELVNAKPTARRAILEEAAGVSGLHQRRHEATLKLDAASRNLARVNEIVEGLDQRLAQLSRQAKQAARYRKTAEALRRAERALAAIRWREAETDREEAEAALAEAAAAAASSQRAAVEAAQAREAAEETAPPAREEAQVATAILARLQAERERLDERLVAAQRAAEEARARLAQISSDAEREAALNRDAAESVARLDAEIAEIDRARAGFDEAEAEARARAEDATARLRDAEAAQEAARERAARLTAEAEAAARRASETAAAAARALRALDEARDAAGRLSARIEALAEGAAEATDRLDAAREAREAAEEQGEAAEAARAEARAALETARAAEERTRSAASAAAGEARALRAETEGLATLVERPVKGAEAVLEQVRVAPGWEGAFGAAFGDDLDAPEARDGAGGWTALPEIGVDAPPEAAEPLGPQVHAPTSLARRLSRVAVVAREAGDALQPGLGPGWRLVSREGDLWRWDGLIRRAGEAPSAAAQRLAQKNRLEALRARLAEADAATAEAAAAREAARAAHDDAAGREREAAAREEATRRARRAAEEAETAAARAAASAETERERAAARLAALAETATAREAELSEAEAAAEAAAEAREALGDPSAAKAEADEARRAVEAARGAAASARAALDELERRDAGRRRRREAAAKERAGWAGRLENAERRAEELDRRLVRARAEAEAAAGAPETAQAETERLAKGLAAAERRKAAAETALGEAETRLREAEAAERAAERAAAEARETRARRETRVEAGRARAEEATARLAEALSGPLGLGAGAGAGGASSDGAGRAERTGSSAGGDGPARPGHLAAGETSGVGRIEALVAELVEAFPDAAAAEAEIERLRRARDALGAVNLRAEEDAREVEAERSGLASEKADLEEAILRLRQGVAELNREGRQRLLSAFEEVRSTFRGLFTHLFGGGEADLVLVESDDPLEAGLEIMAMPPGKKLAALSLLSGGEQTLTALALIFAVFLVNPAPICVLDEVDAPLDDANVQRFCDLLDEMTRRTETRFLVITHHAVTMSRMDRLFGVTMAEPGVSQLVSVDLARAAEMVEA